MICSRDVNTCNLMSHVENRPLIIHACALKHWKFVHVLLRYFPNIWQVSSAKNWSVLIYALISNQMTIVHFIIAQWNNLRLQINQQLIKKYPCLIKYVCNLCLKKKTVKI